MKKIGLVFPGQGSQYAGMGKELYEKHPAAREVLDRANDVLGFDLKKIIFEGPDEVLRQTRYTQPAIFAASLAAFNALAARYDLAQVSCMAAGHSLGEYSALCASGVFSLEDGLKLVKARGEFITRASEKNPGAMAAILGMEASRVEELCAESRNQGACEAVNFNSPGQVVIAGSSAAVQKAVALAPTKGATKAIPLNVSGAFHSSLMTPASEMMAAELQGYAPKAPRWPVVTNCDAQPTADPGRVRDKLVRQINHPVLWEDSVRRMTDAGTELFIEVGPQRVLSGLLRRIDKSRKSLNVEDEKSLENTLATLNA
ncbi:MAG: ACP S-malonyltransferase [Endomicrobiales bacterium]